MNIPTDNLKAKQQACSLKSDAAMSSAQSAFHATSLAMERWKNAPNLQEAISAGIEILKTQQEYNHLVKKARSQHHMANIYKTLSKA